MTHSDEIDEEEEETVRRRLFEKKRTITKTPKEREKLERAMQKGKRGREKPRGVF